MTISLLHIVVPTVLALVVLIVYTNLCKKKVLEEISQLKAQLEKMGNVSVSELPQAELVKNSTIRPEEEIMTENDETEEEKDALEIITMDGDASVYNTGKSGKIYTKEELELLIKE